MAETASQLAFFFLCSSVRSPPDSFLSKQTWPTEALQISGLYRKGSSAVSERVSDSQLCSYVSRWVLICVSVRVKDVL